MIEELRHHGYALSPGTLYPIPHALEAEGYLRSEARTVGGKVRRYYRSTPRGVRTLERLKVKIRELVVEVLDRSDDFPAPGGTVKRFATLIARRPG